MLERHKRRAANRIRVAVAFGQREELGVAPHIEAAAGQLVFAFFFFKQKTAYEIGLGIPAEPLFRSTLILNTFLFGVIILIANILKRAFSSQLAAKLRNRLLVLYKPFFVPFGAVVYSVINIKLGEHIVALCQFIHEPRSNIYKLITNDRSILMAVNIHITIIELNALHTKRQNLFQELDAVIHLLMEAKHWGLRKSRNATSLNSRFKSLDTLKVKIISVTFRRVIRTNHKKASKIWRHENIQLGGCQS